VLHQFSNYAFDPEDISTIVKSVIEDIKLYGDISLGTDVEVLWISKLQTLSGKYKTNFFAADKLFTKSGVIGTDGRSCQGEWRFTPAYDIKVFERISVESLKLCKLMTAIRQEEQGNIPNIYPYGMSIYDFIDKQNLKLPESIGLHIHFGGNFQNGSYVELSVAYLDRFLYPIIKLFEPIVGHQIRTMCGFYGDLSDFEHKTYGFEYKSLPNCIEDRDVFLGTFAIAKALVFEVLTHKFDKKIFETLKIKKDYLGDKSYLRVLSKQAELFIKRNCRLYYIYKDYIDKLFVKANEKSPEEYFSTQEDIFSMWDICCDFDEDPLVHEIKSGALFNPFNKPLKGYLTKIGYSKEPDSINLKTPFVVTTYR